MPPRHDQLPGLVQIASRDRMTDCLSEIPVRLMPRPRAAVKDGGEPWLGPVKLVTQQVTKQMVIPVPVAPAVQPDQEQVAPLHLLQDALGSLAPGHDVTQRPGQP